MADLPLEKTSISLDDLLSEDSRVEIINGEIVEMAAAGILHQIVVGNIYLPMETFNRQHEIGTVFTDGLTYLMYNDPRSLRYSFIPDVSYIRSGNLPAGFDITKPNPGAPDLAVEVVLPNDKAIDIQEKIQTYLDKGTEQVWIAYPELGSQSLHQYVQGSSTVRIYQKPEEVIDASAFFPGIEGLTIAAIFKLPKWAVSST
jgi:Uma2 family endonuclease